VRLASTDEAAVVNLFVQFGEIHLRFATRFGLARAQVPVGGLSIRRKNHGY
jgi:hypothetical protein